MKPNCLILIALLAATAAVGQTYHSPLRLQPFTQAGQLSWSNTICPDRPVYEVLRANSPTGAWQHFFYVTNTQSIPLTNTLGASTGAVFHKLALVGDEPMTFDYSFDDGSGFGPSVVGQLRFAIMNVSALNSAWTFSELLPLGGGHPVGSGNFAAGGLTQNGPGTFVVRLRFTAFSEGVFLEGTLQSSSANGPGQTTGMSGTVYLSGFAGYTPLGTFTATRVFP